MKIHIIKTLQYEKSGAFDIYCDLYEKLVSGGNLEAFLKDNNQIDILIKQFNNDVIDHPNYKNETDPIQKKKI